MRRIVLVALISALASTAAAQAVEPWRTPTDEVAPNRAHVTSGPTATDPAVPAKPAAMGDERAEHALAVAVFAKPAAAQRAADKVAEAHTAPIPPAEPKPEWVAKDGLQVGGKGMKVTTPF